MSVLLLPAPVPSLWSGLVCFVLLFNTRTHFSAPTQSLWSGHSCGGNFSFGERSFGCLGLFPLLRSAIVMLTRVNCLQLQNHEVIVVTVCMRSWKPKGLSINSELITCCGVLLTWLAVGGFWLDETSEKVGRLHWPLFLLSRKRWKNGKILLCLLHCTNPTLWIEVTHPESFLKLCKFCKNCCCAAIGNWQCRNAKFWQFSQSCSVIRGMAWGMVGFAKCIW